MIKTKHCLDCGKWLKLRNREGGFCDKHSKEIEDAANKITDEDRVKFFKDLGYESFK